MLFQAAKARTGLLSYALLSATCLVSMLPANAQADSACPSATGGLITVNTTLNEACELQDGESITVTGTGEITATGNTGVRVVNGVSAGGITVQQNGLINGVTSALDIRGGLANGINVAGQLSSMNYGVDIYQNAVVGDITVQSTGNIQTDSYGGSGLLIRGAATVGNIVNRGNISSNWYGVEINGASTVVGDITNYGTIDGGEGGLAIYSENVGTVTNYGLITYSGTADMFGGAIETASTNTITINNYGTLDGIVRLQAVDLNLLGNGALNTVNGQMRVTGEIMGTNDTRINIGNNANPTNMTLEANVTAGELNIHRNSRLSVSGQTLTVGNVNNNGRLNLGTSETYIDGDYRQSNAVLSLKANDLTTYGRLNVSGTATIEGTSSLYVDVSGATIDFANDDRLEGVVHANTITVVGNPVVETNSVLYNFRYVLDNANQDMDIIFERAANTSVKKSLQKIGNGAGAGAAPVLDNIINNNPGGNFDDVKNAFASLTSDQEISDAVTKILPVVTGGTTQATINTMGTTGRIVQARQEANLGISSGDGFVTSGNWWVKPFGSWAKNDSNASTPGFKADGFGIIGGVDGLLSSHTRGGVALTYANNSVQGLDAASTQQVDINTYSATLYGSYSLSDATEVNLRAGGGYSNNDGQSLINFGGLNITALSDYDTYHLDLSAGVGHTVMLGEGTSFVPSVRVDYLAVRNEGYTQTGGGGFNQNIGAQTTEQLAPTVDAKLFHRFTDAFSAVANAGIGYDFLAEQSVITSSFVGGGSAFTTTGIEPSPWIVSLGGGLTFLNESAFELSARYDAELRGSDYYNQTVSLKMRAPF
jgi:outer membrane autotransporter protein